MSYCLQDSSLHSFISWILLMARSLPILILDFMYLVYYTVLCYSIGPVDFMQNKTKPPEDTKRIRLWNDLRLTIYIQRKERHCRSCISCIAGI